MCFQKACCTGALRSLQAMIFCTLCLLSACSAPNIATLEDAKPAMGSAGSCEGVSGTCYDFDLGDRHAISLPASRIFNPDSANLTHEAVQTLAPIARSMKTHAARWVSVGVFSRDHDTLATATAHRQAQVLVEYFTRAHVGARMIYQRDRPVKTVPGLDYFTGTHAVVPQVKIEYGV